MNCIVATVKSWNIQHAATLLKRYPQKNIVLIQSPDQLCDTDIDKICPQYIFFPHWSWVIPKDIYENYTCVVFHMTDLPFGRGGSPLQNLLVRGIYQTQISAIRVTKGMDTGDVYMKVPFDISYGNADEILRRASDIIFDEMIPRFFEEELHPYAQSGEVVQFRRRTPEQSKIPDGLSQRQLYDYIRMLDGEGYPPAFIQTEQGKIVFRNAVLKDNQVIAEARFEAIQ